MLGEDVRREELEQAARDVELGLEIFIFRRMCQFDGIGSSPTERRVTDLCISWSIPDKNGVRYR